LTRSTITPDATQIDAQTPLYNSAIISNYIKYLKSQSIDFDIEALLKCSGINRFDLNDEGHFLTQKEINRFHRCLDKMVDDPDIAYRVGRHTLYLKSTGTLIQYGMQFITIPSMYKVVDRIYSKWSRGHLSRTIITGKSQAEMTISVLPGVREEPFQCRNRQGIFETIAAIQTGKPAQVEHPQCMHRGDDVCRYRIAWKEKPSATWNRMGVYAGILSVLCAAGLPFFVPARIGLLTTLVMGLICLSIFLVGSRLEKRELTGRLKEQGDTADLLLQEIETRHNNARLVQEIGQASVDILEVNTFLASVLESMARNPDFTSGMVALLEDGGRHLCPVASYGIPETEWKRIERMELTVDLDAPGDIFIQSLKKGRPLFFREMETSTVGMTPERIEIIEHLKSDSLISMPLIHKKEPLGLLFVNTNDTKRHTSTSDINLLMGIASQISTGIVNARSYSQIQESEQRYRLLAESVTDVIWVLDLETLRLKYISPSATKAIGYTPDELLAMQLDQYLTPASFERATRAIFEATEGVKTGRTDPASASVTLELEELHKNGTLLPIEVTAGFLLDGMGMPNAVLGISRDLSERKKAERQRAEIEYRLQQSKKMESLGTMAGSIAHNFNNLLMVVLGNLELAKEELPEPSTTVTNIQRAINAAQRSADLSNMMLTYVGQLKKENAPVDLSQVAEAVLENMDESTMSNVKLDLELADPMPLVIADVAQMRQMVSGFVTNAIEALENENGRVRISTGAMHCDRNYLSTLYLKEEMAEGMYAYVEVADTGCGMDTETLTKVFDPFFSTKFTGRGLDMAAVMGIIRSHGGAVKVVSEKNKGAVFTALFPVRGSYLRAIAPESAQTETRIAGKTVLLVDDDTLVMEVGSQFLERLGYTVRSASNGQEALDILDQTSESIDCLLLDYTMPGMDGLETMQRAKAIRPETRVIITSGYTRQQIEDQFTAIARPDDFIQKPFEMKGLGKKLSSVLSKGG
jgi:PAS domain S-box-containing protein